MASTSVNESLISLSNALANAVERAGAAVVAVNGRPRTPSTGVIWRKGVVVTTNHTLQQDDGITIELPGGKELAATIAGRDPGTDLAALRVAEVDSGAALIGDSTTLKPGNFVLALGRGPTAALGVISSIGGQWRTWRGGSIDQRIRPDVSIYTGFSGGALVDAGGRIVGLNTSALSRGTPITIPVSTVNRVIDDLVSRGRVARGYIGLGMQPVRLPDTLRATANISNEVGLMVVSLEQAGPAETAGITLGDVLVGLDETPLSDLEQLQATLSGDRIGKIVHVKVLRGGKAATIDVTIGERP